MSERKLATIRVVKDIQSIPGADLIVQVMVDGWIVVSKIGQFAVGDKCVYMEIDSYLPICEKFEFLRKSSYRKFPDGVEGLRLKSMKLRGVISQGLIMPLADVGIKPSTAIGTDVTDKLGIRLYEPDLLGQEHIKRSWLRNKLNYVAHRLGLLFMTKAQKKKLPGSFPHFVPKTDEPRIQNLDISKLQGIEYEVSEKLDGSSETVANNEGDFWVCSRNMKLGAVLVDGVPTGQFDGAYWKMAIKYDLENKLKNYPTPNIAIQGELVGPGIQQNKYKLKEVQLHVFKIWLINERRYANSMERLQMCQDLGLEHVPVLDTITFDFKTVAEVLAYAEGKSKLCPTQEREGVVFKALNGSHSFKAISNKFLLKCEE